MRSNLGFKIWDYQCESFRRLGHPNVPRLFKFELTYPSNFLESEDDSFVEKSEKVHYTLRARARRHVWKHFVENCHPTNLSFKSKFCLGLWRWVRGSQYPAILPRWKSENQRDTKNSIKKAGKSRNSKAERQGREREGMTTSIAEFAVLKPIPNTWRLAEPLLWHDMRSVSGFSCTDCCKFPRTILFLCLFVSLFVRLLTDHYTAHAQEDENVHEWCSQRIE